MQDILNRLHKDAGNAPKLSLESKFKFRCHKGISCFNRCCGDLEIFLTPFDILRMKNALQMTSGEFLSEYTDPVIFETNFLPFLKLKLDGSGKCRFVSPEGCTIYDDRPLACRYYPLGFGAFIGGTEKGDFYFLVKEGHCEGFGEDQEWKVRDWKSEEGIVDYEDANKDWIDLILSKKYRSADLQPDEKSMKMFFMGSYDLDSFRSFVFESRFLQLFDLQEEFIALIKNNEVELLKFAHRWLKFVLFKEPTLSLK